MKKKFAFATLLAISGMVGSVQPSLPNSELGPIHQFPALDFGADFDESWSRDGKCDDPRFEGPGTPTKILGQRMFRDAFDCYAAYMNQTVKVRRHIGDIDFGLDEDPIKNINGECDDPRFEGPGMSDFVTSASTGQDASDCLRAYVLGRIVLRVPDIDEVFLYGDDSSEYAFDGECDDGRFEDIGSENLRMAESFNKNNVGADATDCRDAYQDNHIRPLRTTIGKIFFGDNSSEHFYDGECDDPRFEDVDENDPRMAEEISMENLGADAADCHHAFLVRAIQLSEPYPTPLYPVAHGKSPEFISDLYKSSDYLAMKDEDGLTPLHRAARYNEDPDVISTLIDASADPNEKDHNENTPLHWAAKYNKNPEVLTALIEKGSTPNATNKLGRTPLHWAAWHNKNPDVIRALIRAGADPDIQDNNGVAPLNSATWSVVPIGIVSALLEGGADPNTTTRNGWTPLHGSASTDIRPDLTKLLLSNRANPNATHDEGWTPLHQAAWYNKNPAIISLLVEKGADVNAKTTAEHRTAIFQAAANDNLDVVAALLKAKADPNIPHINGRTPLHRAVENGNRRMIEILLEYGASRDIEDEDGTTPWDLAVQNEVLSRAFSTLPP